MKDLLVTITDKNASFGRPELTAACRGHNNMGVVLNYFVFEASMEAKNKRINKDEVEYVEIKRTQEEILEGIHGATQSKKTINLYTKQFQEWGFIDADSYHHKYKVYFKNIQAAIDNHPPVDPPKPRGVHAKKVKDDTNGKNAISPNGNFTPDDRDAKIAILANQMVKMASEMVKMRSKIAKLENERSSESASEDVLDDIFDPLESIRLLEIIKDKEYVPIGTANEQTDFSSQQNDQETIDANPTPSSSSSGSSTPTPASVRNNTGISPIDPSPSPDGMEDIKNVEHPSRTNDTVLPIAPTATRKRVSKKKTVNTEPLLQTALPELTKQEPNLSEKARAVWNVWLKMPWNKIAPKLTETAAKHCEDLSKVDLTEEILWQVINYARKNDKNSFYNGRAIQLGDIVREYPKWSNAQHTQANQSKVSVSSASAYTLDEIKALRRMTTEQRKDFNQKRRDSVNAVAASSSYVSSYA